MEKKQVRTVKKMMQKFDNGATLVYAYNPLSTTTQATIGFRCGSQFDGEYTGLCHLLEHMLFVGNSKERRDKFSEIFRDTATYSNATTTFESISVNFDCPSVNLDTIMKVNSEILFTKDFDARLLENEKHVVLHEYDSHFDDDTLQNYLSTLTRESLFDQIVGIRYKRNYEDIYQVLLGTEETLSKISPQTLTDFSNKYFVGENMVISVVSSLPFEVVSEMCDKYFVSKVESKPEHKVKLKPFRDLFVLSYIKKHTFLGFDRANAKEFQMKLIFKTPRYSDKDATIFRLFDRYLFNGDTGLLMKKLRHETGFTYTSWQSSFAPLGNSSQYSVFNLFTNPENAFIALKLFSETLGEVVKNGITEKELERFKFYVSSLNERVVLRAYDCDNLFYATIRKQNPFKGVDLNVDDLTVEDINRHLRYTYGLSKVGLTFDGDMTKAQHLYTEQELYDIIDDISAEPMTVPQEVIDSRIDEFTKDYTSQIIKVPPLEVFLEDFNIQHLIMKDLREKIKILYEPRSKERTSKFRTLPKANYNENADDQEKLEY